MTDTRRHIASIVSCIAALIAPALAQKVDNPVAVPTTVRPGVIEAQYDMEVVPGVSMTPNVVSPYQAEQETEAGSIEFQLSEITLDGAQTISATTLAPIYADRLGQTVKLAEIFAIARSITRHYAEAGFPLSLAYVPVQEIENGRVRIRIIEGFVGEVDVSGAPLRVQPRLKEIAARITAERPLTKRGLERNLLLANQIPGLNVTAVLERGTSPESGVKMTFKVAQKRFSVAAGFNNRASRAVGREQFNGMLRVNNIITGTDSFRFLAVQSVNLDELTFFSGGYSTVLNADGLTLDLAATRSEAAPGVPLLRNLGFETMGWTAGAGISYPLILKRQTQLTVSGRFTWKEFQSAFGVSPNTLDALWTSEFSAAAKFKDPLDGSIALGATITRGWDIFDATDAGSPLASRQGAGAEFLALSVDFGRTQKLSDTVSLSLSAKAQTANNPLLSSEQCGYGGAGFGRGYDPFEIAGDRCIVGRMEVSASPDFLKLGKFRATPFVSVDAGAVRQIGPLAAGEARTASLYSFAAGAYLKFTKHLSATVEVGVPLKGIVAQEGDDDPRFFFSLQARY